MESEETQINATQKVTRMIRDTLPNIPLFPAMGNHESFPASLYYQPQDGWLTKTLWDAWSEFLPSDQQANVLNAGYYTALIEEGLRVLSFNTEFGYVINFYSLLNDQISAPKEQYEFMAATLLAARLAGEKVIIIGHIPPGSHDALPAYGDTYVDLFLSFSDVIVANIVGHTHRDGFQVIYNPVDLQPTGVALVAPSVTTYTNTNPSFRIYTFAKDTFELLDYQQYHTNLTQSNADGRITWSLGLEMPGMRSVDHTNRIHCIGSLWAP